MYPMRRNKQMLTQEECKTVLERCTSGVLALCDEMMPYAVPLSYVYVDGCLYFHCAQSGRKLDIIRTCSHASFCVIDQDQVVPCEFTTYFRSVIVFGQITEIQDEMKKRHALYAMAKKYAPQETKTTTQTYVEKDYPHVAILEMQITDMSGKEAKELAFAKTNY